MVDRNLFYNASGCADPTAYNAIQKADYDQTVERVNRLIKDIKYLITESGFVLLNRIELKDEASGKIFK